MGRQATGFRQQATGNRQQATGNRRQATCNRKNDVNKKGARQLMFAAAPEKT